MLHVPVKLMEIDITKELTRHVAERQPFAFFFLETVEHDVYERKRFFVRDAPADQLPQNGMVYRIKEFPHVAFEYPDCLLIIQTGANQKTMQPINTPMGAFAFPACERVVDELFLEYRRKRAEKRLMHHTVAHGRLVDMAAFRVLHIERHIRIRNIRSGLQFTCELDQIVFKAKLKFRDFGFCAFAALEFPPCGVQI